MKNRKFTLQMFKIHLAFKLIFVILLSSITIQLNAQEWKTEKKVNVVFGALQPIFAKGFNIEGNYLYNRLIFGYSHGASLDISGTTTTEDLREQRVAVHMPYTTGLGIGYRLKEWVNVRIEPKWHRFEFYYEGELQNSSTQITFYNTMSLGVGIYGHYQPFKNKSSWLKGIMIAPSVRFWPTITSTLKGDSYTYQNKQTGRQEEIKTLDPGPGFSPLIINVSIGYSFGL